MTKNFLAWLTPGDCVPLVEACPSGFSLLHQPRLTSRGGGVNMNVVDFAFFFRLLSPVNHNISIKSFVGICNLALV